MKSKRMVLLKKCGSGEVGEIYVLGLHGVPVYELHKDTKSDEWWWREGSKKEDNEFYKINWAKEGVDYKLI